MNAPSLVTDAAVHGDIALQEPVSPPPSEASGTGGRLLRGTAVLGASVMVERGTGFLANILAARFAGAPVFGAYSLGISTANNISTYAAGGIGATATRFSGKYNEQSGGYAIFARVLAVVSLLSAAIAAAALWAGAKPIASLLHKPELAQLLRWAALSAAGMILLESARGFFVGQRRLAALGTLSLTVGAGMLLMLPAVAATHNPTAMITVQGAITVGAVGLCLAFARPLRLLATTTILSSTHAFGPMLREVWGFGLIQLTGLLSANLAGWWLTALVARGDTTLAQMGFFAIASQLRNLTGVVPALLTESSYSVMAGEQQDSGRPDRVMALCTYASIVSAFVLAGTGMLIGPWLLHLLYGARYANATFAAAVGMAVAVVQMGNAPPSARMSVVSVRWVAAGNTFWAIFVGVVGSLWMWRGGSAALAMTVFLAGHVLLAAMVFTVLRLKGHLPQGVVPLFVLSTVAMVALAALTGWRAGHADQQMRWTLVMLLVFACSLGAVVLLGKRENWMVALDRPICMVTRAAQRLPMVGRRGRGNPR